jgi:hypothetical protein
MAKATIAQNHHGLSTAMLLHLLLFHSNPSWQLAQTVGV